jgi:hypothetical protein
VAVLIQGRLDESILPDLRFPIFGATFFRASVSMVNVGIENDCCDIISSAKTLTAPAHGSPFSSRALRKAFRASMAAWKSKEERKSVLSDQLCALHYLRL